jgi:hypothetical protein
MNPGLTISIRRIAVREGDQIILAHLVFRSKFLAGYILARSLFLTLIIPLDYKVCIILAYLVFSIPVTGGFPHYMHT